jgi:phage terminase large subunit-like protein
VLERRQTIAARLTDFSTAGDLTIVDHASEDIEEMAGIIADIAERGLLGCVAVDPAGLGEFVEAMAEIDVTVENKLLVGAPQGYGMMNAIKTAERKLENGTLVHGRSGLMDWCVGNVKIEPTATAIRATKQNAGDAKIDPWAALMNAVWVMSRNPEARSNSGWNTDDLDGLMARIDAAVEAMSEMGDPESGRQVLHGIGTPA